MEDNQTEDSRRFTIYFRANDHLNAHAISDLKINQYVQLYNSDKNAWTYVKNNLSNIFNEGEDLLRLWRSIDDVHYTIVKSPAEFDSQPSNSEEKSQMQSDYMKDVTKASQVTTPVLDNDNDNILSNADSSATLDSTHKHLDDLDTEINTNTSYSKGSIIWNHVKKVEKDNIIYTQCNYCLKLFKYANNTTNMTNHLSRKHPIFFKKPKKEKISNYLSTSNKQIKRSGSQEIRESPKKKLLYETEKENATISFVKENDQNKKITKNTSNVVSVKEQESNEDIRVIMKSIDDISAGGSKSDKITNWIVYMLCRDLCPISTVEKEGFLQLMKFLVPLYKVPSRKTVTGIIENKYYSMQKVFSTELDNIDYYCITADNWTDCSQQGYIGVTIHYLNKDTILKSGILGCIPLYERHNAEYLENSLLEIFKDFSIKKEKITAIATDGGSGIKKAAISIIGSSRHIQCIAHIMSHILPDAIKNNDELTALINKTKSIVKLIRSSTPANDKLIELQLQDTSDKNSATYLKLIQEVPTRWTTTVDMLDRYISLEKYIYTAMLECCDPIDILNREETKIIRDVLQLMKPVNITELSGEKYATAGVVIPLINCLKLKLSSYNPATEIGNKLKAAILIQINDKFSNVEDSILGRSTILDPRFKKLHFKKPLAVANHIAYINNMLTKMGSVSESQVCDEVTVNLMECESLWDIHDFLKDKSDTHIKPYDMKNCGSKHTEISMYLQQQCIDKNKNIFTYWRDMKEVFPFLSVVALKQLCILSTTVPSERLFSKAGLIKRFTRNKLSGTHLNMLVFLSCFSVEEWKKY